MKNITLKSSALINPLYFVALNSLAAKELPVTHMKQLRRIVKKLRDELKDIQEDTDIIIRDTFGDSFSKEEVISLVRADDKTIEKIVAVLKLSPERIEEYKKLLPKFNEKAKELGESEIEIPFPKIVLPEKFEFRTDYAAILEDVIDLD